ncbi:GFA family protein [Oceanobacter mangrovi]|uniref:GFA family protein n=1 Tax=Oceanobacter mangrovi TaxID=2862510 RepID=UPI001C8D73E8|nr:GFA family protein [Oceanobacter mangrovi]
MIEERSTGQCNCGAVRFEIRGRLPGMYQCHCSLCRRQSGAGSNAATIVRREDFDWLAGLDSISQWRKPSGFQSHFCNVCGCPVPNPFMAEKYLWIPVGLLDGAHSEIVAHVQLESRADWDVVTDAPTMLPHMPENIDDFIEYLYASSQR